MNGYTARVTKAVYKEEARNPDLVAHSIEPEYLEQLGELRLRSAHLQHLKEFGMRRSVLAARERLALDILAEQSPLTMGGLASLCQCTKSTMTAVVDRLVKSHYVRRESPEWDRRSVHVWITDTGRELAEEHRQIHLAEARDMLTYLSAQEQELMVRAYRGIVMRLERESQQPTPADPPTGS